MRRICALAVGFAALLANAEQFKQFGDWQVHYIAFNASLLSPEVAERYDLVRGRTKGLLTISAIGPGGSGGEKVAVEGRFLNLLGQSTALEFREIEDDAAVYYLAAFDFQNAEVLRFEIAVALPHGVETLRFQQPLYAPAR